MLTESLVASTLPRAQGVSSSTVKDVGIQVYEVRPQFAPRDTFKKSSTNLKCLAVSSTHIYAAQTDKAVVHVYNRARANQETVVAFPERIHSLLLTNGNDGMGVLVLGMESGRLILWEVSTGRSISTATSHLQPVTSLAQSPDGNFILSGSTDSNIHVWSLPNLLSFYDPNATRFGESTFLSPIHSLSNHRAAVTDLAIGHSGSSSNIAVSISRENIALVWNFQNGTLLQTYLLPTTPICVSVDPADRAFYLGYENGSVQAVDFFATPSLQQGLHDSKLQNSPIQLDSSDCWDPPISDIGSANSIALSYDGTNLYSAHAGGKILSWEIAKRKYISTLADLTSPVTNLIVLPPGGFLDHNRKQPSTALQNVVKARYDHLLAGGTSQKANGTVPQNYTITATFPCSFRVPEISASTSPEGPPSTITNSFTSLLSLPIFPDSLIAESLAELSSFSTQPLLSATKSTADDMIMLESPLDTLHTENDALKQKIESLETDRDSAWTHAIELNELIHVYRQAERDRAKRKRQRREKKRAIEEREREEWVRAHGGGNENENGAVARSGEGNDKEEEEEGDDDEDMDDGEDGRESESSESGNDITESD